MSKIRVYFESTVTYAADLDYDELAELAEDSGDGELVVPGEAALSAANEFAANAFPGEALSERLWDIGTEVDSSETRVTGLIKV